MNKKILFLVPILFSLFPILTVLAMEKILDNYYFVHTNKPGTYVLGDRFGNKSLRADASNNNGVIVNLSFKAFKGLGTSDRLYVRFPNGSTKEITNDVIRIDEKPTSLQVILEKATNEETYIALYSVSVDDADSPETIRYVYGGETPTRYGDLGQGDPGSGGSDGGNAQTIPINAYYVPYRDEYRADYVGPPGTAKYQLYFKAASGAIYTLDYAFKPTGIHYLTCNGTYNLNFFDASGNLIAKTEEVKTTQIQAPACRSYEDSEGAGRNELNAKIDPNGDMVWNDPPSGTKEVQIWKDGQKVATKNPSEKIYEKPGSGSYSVVAVDDSGKPIGQSDLNVGGSNGGGGEDPGGGSPPGDGTCSTCDKLDELLNCPGWDVAMGDLTEAIRNALPPPPNWDEIADKIGRATVRHLSDYLGDVPEPPSKEEIRQNTDVKMPDISTAVPETEDLKPKVPGIFENGQIPFRIEEDAPTFKVEDNSKPFRVEDPLSNMKYDDPGVPVFPGDPRNSSEGIKSPDQVNTGGAPSPKTEPSPIPTPGGPPSPNIPPSEIPKPSDPGGGAAVPDATDGPIPIPKNTE